MLTYCAPAPNILLNSPKPNLISSRCPPLGAYDAIEESIRAQEQGLRWTEHPTLLAKVHTSTDIGVPGGRKGGGKSTDWSKGTSKTMEAVMV